uniref:Aminopeptidase O (putative) n=1 Tax=Sphaeramia orbicularis TaxID=375764 RepID=A0A672ZPD6_9TELE
MEPDENLNPDSDDLPLRANTNHILVRHYVLDLTIDFDRKVIAGCAVLFLEPRPGGKTGSEEETRSGAVTGVDRQTQDVDITDDDDGEVCGEAGACGAKSDLESTARHREGWKGDFQAAGESKNVQSPPLWETTSDSDFTLVLDCCDLDVSKVEEVDVGSVSAMSCLSVEHPPETAGFASLTPQAALIQNLISMPSNLWRQQHQCYSQCSSAPCAQDGNSLPFHTDRWSLQVRKKGAATSQEFPRVLRIFYETRPTGGSVRWTKDQDNRVCVYTAGSPINNRALFPCQEPPVAMSTWQATVRAPSECAVLMSGEEQAVPLKDEDTRFLIWNYHVTMPMPASTFTLAVGHWFRVPAELPPSLETGLRDRADCMVDDGISCSHGDYPCRFTKQPARSQRVIPHRVFAPVCLHQKAQGVVKLLPHCLAAAHTVLGVHPFPRLDVLIVPAGFSSLGMASPHIIFLSQSALDVGSSGRSEKGLSLCGSRLCHEIAHSWFGLVIGAKDWTEEWISEGFATYLEDIIWAQAQKLSLQETAEQSDLKALLRWRRLSDELQNSEQELQILRPNMESTGQVSESGSSMVKHALNPDKTFMQVHYLKGYFLLRFLASQVGEQQFINFFRLFVKKYHGQLILSQVSQQRKDLVRHRWCELVVKHGYTQAYRDVEHFLVHNQAMGVYLYGELMVQEDAEQQALARRCLSLVQEEMDQSARRVVEEMIL